MIFWTLAKNYMISSQLSRIRCHCRNCGNLYKYDLENVRAHLFTSGFDKLYRVWTFHGEGRMACDNMDPIEEAEAETVSNSPENDNFFDMLNDLREVEVVGSNVVDQEEDNEDITTEKKLRENHVPMFEAAHKELYLGFSKFSAFSFLVKLMHIKVMNGWSNKSFDILLQLLFEAFPKPNTIPSSHYEAKNGLKDLGLR